MDLGYSPNMRRKKLGQRLKQLRGKMTVTALAAKLGCSPSKITRLENADVDKPDLVTVLDILDVLGIDDEAIRDELEMLAREGNKPGWWKAYRRMPAQQTGYAELEHGAGTIREYADVFVPGLLQATEYARIRFNDGEAYSQFDMSQALAGRQERQKILTRADHPVEYEAVLDEAIFRRRTAEPAAMREQIGHLLHVADLDNVTLRVLLFGAGIEGNSWPLNPFSLYTFADDPEMVAVETESSDMHLGDEEDLDRYRLVYERIKAAALNPDESAKFIEGAQP